MAYTDHFDNVQKLYIAYYQRPADPEGLVSWAKAIEKAGDNAEEFQKVLNAFASSPESTNLYSGGIDRTNIGVVIRQIYKALFNHEGDPEGRNHYYDKYMSDEYTAGQIAWEILNAAGDSVAKDATTVKKKVDYANKFTEIVAGKQIQDPDFPSGKGPWNFTYAGNAAAQEARDLLAKVDEKNAAVKNDVERSILDSEHIAKDTDPGHDGGIKDKYSKVLTAGQDIFVGGNHDDVVYAPTTGTMGTGSTLDNKDELDGGLGINNTLRVDMPMTGGSVIPSGTGIKRFQVLDINTSSLMTGNQEIIVNTLNNAKEVEKIHIHGNNRVVNITGSESLKEVTYALQGGNSLIRGDNVAEISIGQYAAVTPPSANALRVESKNETVKIDVDYAAGLADYTVAGGVKNVHIHQDTTTSTNGRINQVRFDKSVESLKVDGDVVGITANGANNANANISLVGTGTTNLTALDFSTFTGNDKYDTNILKPSAALDVKLGSGNETLQVNSVVGAGSTINLGAGDDYLKAGSGSINGGVTLIDGGAGTKDKVDISLINPVNAGKFKNFEIVNVLKSGGTHNIKGMEFEYLELSEGALSKALTIDGLGNDTIFTVTKDNAGNSGDFASAEVTLSNQNNLTLNYEDGATGGSVVLNSSKTSDLFINNTSGKSQSLILRNFNDLEEIIVTGSKGSNVNIVGYASTTDPVPQNHVGKIDASGLEGNLSVDFSVPNSKMSDSSILTVIGGKGNDGIKLDGGHESVFLTGGAGNDQFNVVKNNAGTGATKSLNTITDFTKGDSIIIPAGMVSGTIVNDITIPNTSYANHLADVSVYNSGAVGLTSWFKTGSDYYLIISGGNGATIDDDTIIKLQGVGDLTNALAVNVTGGTTSVVFL